jgi:hypothetical protein
LLDVGDDDLGALLQERLGDAAPDPAGPARHHGHSPANVGDLAHALPFMTGPAGPLSI